MLGLLALLAAPEESLPPEIKLGLPQVMAGAMKLLVALRTQQEEAAKAEAEGEEEEDEEEGDWDEGGEAEEGEGAEDDGDDEEEEAYMKRLTKLAAKAAAAGEEDDNDDDDDGSDDEWTDDEEEETPIDAIDPFVLFADSLAGLQAALPARHAGLIASVADDAARAALQGILVLAAQEKALQAKRAADEAAGGAAGKLLSCGGGRVAVMRVADGL